MLKMLLCEEVRRLMWKHIYTSQTKHVQLFLIALNHMRMFIHCLVSWSKFEQWMMHETQQASDIFTLVVKNGFISSFPNIEIALWIYLSLMITNATGERSFSKQKLIKNAHRSTMGQNRLNRLSLMSIENDVLNNVQFTTILETFVSKKLHRANVLIIILLLAF